MADTPGADARGIGGIRLSEELIQVDICGKESVAVLGNLLEFLSNKEIPVLHFHQGADGARRGTSLCLKKAASSFLQRFLSGLSLIEQGCISVWPGRGTISLFPHRFDLAFCGQIIWILRQADIPLYGVSTSVSKMVLHTDFDLLDTAVINILHICQLPKNHTPLRPKILFGEDEVETEAVYWEHTIRIFGITRDKGLAELHCDLPKAHLADKRLLQFCQAQGRFRFLLQQNGCGNTVYLDLLFDGPLQSTYLEPLQEMAKDLEGMDLRVSHGREMVSFHGPHFQDRHGIVRMALWRLSQAGIVPLRTGCTGSSIHMVTEENGVDEIISCLEDVFVVP